MLNVIVRGLAELDASGFDTGFLIGGTTLNTKGGSGAVLPATSCKTPCAGNTKTLCGGINALTLYHKK